MRRASFSRILITLVLILWTPWCYCRLNASACGAPAPEGDRAACSCCERAKGACDEQSRDPCTDATEADHDHCGSACCAPKVPTPPWTPHIPCDTVGCDIPSTMIATLPDVAAREAATAIVAEWPPGKTSGRFVLLVSSILRV